MISNGLSLGIILFTPDSNAWLVYIWRLRGPKNEDEDGPPAEGLPLLEIFCRLLNGFVWSNNDTAIEALVLAPVRNAVFLHMFQKKKDSY